MRPIQTPVANTILKSDQEGVEPLAVQQIGEMFLSTWEPDDGERVRLSEGASVELAVHASPPPPVSVIIAAPFCQECGERMDWSVELQTYVCPHDT